MNRKAFRALADWWHSDTDARSIVRDKLAHPAYLQIMEMGDAVTPFILEDLAERGGHWFDALRVFAGADAPAEPPAGGIRAAKRTWLDWGRERHLV